MSLILWTSVLELKPMETPVGTELANSVGPGWVHECEGLSSSQVLLMLLVQRPPSKAPAMEGLKAPDALNTGRTSYHSPCPAGTLRPQGVLLPLSPTKSHSHSWPQFSYYLGKPIKPFKISKKPAINTSCGGPEPGTQVDQM